MSRTAEESTYENAIGHFRLRAGERAVPDRRRWRAGRPADRQRAAGDVVRAKLLRIVPVPVRLQRRRPAPAAVDLQRQRQACPSVQGSLRPHDQLHGPLLETQQRSLYEVCRQLGDVQARLLALAAASGGSTGGDVRPSARRGVVASLLKINDLNGLGYNQWEIDMFSLD